MLQLPFFDFSIGSSALSPSAHLWRDQYLSLLFPLPKFAVLLSLAQWSSQKACLHSTWLCLTVPHERGCTNSSRGTSLRRVGMACQPVSAPCCVAPCRHTSCWLCPVLFMGIFSRSHVIRLGNRLPLVWLLQRTLKDLKTSCLFIQISRITSYNI